LSIYSFSRGRTTLTRLIKHLVALIQDENANAAKTESLVADKSLETTWSTNNDVGAGVLVLEGFHVRLDGSTTIEDGCLDVGHILAETVVLITNLVSKLTSVAHDHNRNFSVDGLDLLQSSKDEDSRLTKTGLGLADNITTE
jgi:hypothetical protein